MSYLLSPLRRQVSALIQSIPYIRQSLSSIPSVYRTMATQTHPNAKFFLQMSFQHIIVSPLLPIFPLSSSQEKLLSNSTLQNLLRQSFSMLLELDLHSASVEMNGKSVEVKEYFV